MNIKSDNVEIQNLSSNDANSTLALKSERLGLCVQVDDVPSSERAIMKGRVEMRISLMETIIAINAIADEAHNSSRFRCNFDVDRYDSHLNIIIADIHESEYPVVKIKINESFNGNVMVYFMDDDGLYHGSRDVKVVNGAGELTFDKTFKPGEHSATVS